MQAIIPRRLGGSMPKKTSSKEKDTIIWVRAPKDVSLAKIKDLGLGEGHCYGGDTCIAATAMTKNAAIVVKGPKSKSLKQLLRNSRLNPRDVCYGGDTCIV
jgi:hypothetical protein